MGAVAARAFQYLRRQREEKLQKDKESRRKENYFDSVKNISDVQMMKNELDSLEVERSIITNSASRVHDIYREGKLSQLEFDRLMIKYTDDLKKCDEEIEKTRSVVDLYDLTSIRNNLVTIVENKIKVIDSRLNELSKREFTSGIQASKNLHDASNQNLKHSSLVHKNIDELLHNDADRIKKLEIEISQALEKLDSQRSRDSNSESQMPIGVSNNDNITNPLVQPDHLNVSNRKDPLRNLH